MNPLKVLQDYGQSIWLDYIRRSLILSGDLQRMVEEDGLRGVTSMRSRTNCSRTACASSRRHLTSS